jgi:hypothetical protein
VSTNSTTWASGANYADLRIGCQSMRVEKIKKLIRCYSGFGAEHNCVLAPNTCLLDRVISQD